MQKSLEQFLTLSALLTGFSRFQLLGLDIAADHLATCRAMFPEGVLDELLAAWSNLTARDDLEAAVEVSIVLDPKLWPVAENLILLWYTGSWTMLSDSWHSVYGASPLEKAGVVSARSYLAGLQWKAAGAHPAGSAQQGFASWSRAPKGAAQ